MKKLYPTVIVKFMASKFQPNDLNDDVVDDVQPQPSLPSSDAAATVHQVETN